MSASVLTNITMPWKFYKQQFSLVSGFSDKSPCDFSVHSTWHVCRYRSAISNFWDACFIWKCHRRLLELQIKEILLITQNSGIKITENVVLLRSCLVDEITGKQTPPANMQLEKHAICSHVTIVTKFVLSSRDSEKMKILTPLKKNQQLKAEDKNERQRQTHKQDIFDEPPVVHKESVFAFVQPKLCARPPCMLHISPVHGTIPLPNTKSLHVCPLWDIQLLYWSHCSTEECFDCQIYSFTPPSATSWRHWPKTSALLLSKNLPESDYSTCLKIAVRKWELVFSWKK